MIRKIYGMDVGRHFDQSALMGLQKDKIEPINILHGVDFVSQAEYIAKIIHDNPIYLDVTGLGRGLADILERSHRCRVVPITLGSGNVMRVHRDGFWVGKQYLVSLINMSMGSFQVGPTVSEQVKQEFRNQLTAMQVKAGRITRFEGKSGAHDDLVIAYGLVLLGSYLSGSQERPVGRHEERPRGGQGTRQATG